MYFSKSILILEDNLKILSKLLDKLATLEQDQPYELSIIVITNEQQVVDYLNNNPKASFDIALLDRDAKLGDNFHKLDIERFGPEKIIGISSVPEYNEDLRRRGVNKVITKDLANLEKFTEEVIRTLTPMIRELPE